MNVFAEGPPGAGWALESVTVPSAGRSAELLWLCTLNQGLEEQCVHPGGNGAGELNLQGGLGAHLRGGLRFSMGTQ